MSFYKRRDRHRRDGKVYLPRSAWKNQKEPIYKSRKNKKPYYIERRVANEYTKDGRLVADLFLGRIYGQCEWERIGLYHTLKDAEQALKDIIKGQEKYNIHKLELEYRIRFTGNKIEK